MTKTNTQHQNKNQSAEASNRAEANHQPVLLEAVLQEFQPAKGESYLDLTAGYGGHASAILEKTLGPAVLVDRDEKAMTVLKERFGNGLVEFMHTDFLSAVEELVRQGRKFDMILADLGVSSPQFDEGGRGFSFGKEAELDMRMDQRQQLTAEVIVNDYPQDKLESLIRAYGEEPFARRIAKAIVAARPIKTTTQLADIIEQEIHRRGKIHPATRTFQAIRIAVNDELGQIEATLPQCLNLLAPGGRLGLISFHSLEDRIVKRYLGEQSKSGYESTLRLLTKKPISGKNDVNNPRARSAKLRVAVKI